MTEEKNESAGGGRPRRTSWFRRLLVLLAAFLGLAVLLAAVAGLWFRAQLRQSLPAREGSLAAPRLSAEVEVDFDGLGIPVIRGADRLDVAVATGFVHAQDRFFQMDLQRRRAAGELAELFGKRPLGLDRRIRIHRLRARAREVTERLPAPRRRLLEAYAAGVNAGLEALGAAPFEYVLTRSEPRPWIPEDSVLVLLSMFVQLNDTTGNRESDRGLMYDVLPAALADFLTPQGTEWDAPLLGGPFATPPVPDPGQLAGHPPASSRPARHDLPTDARPTSPPAGSNAWAVSGEHTADGKALLAVDMHLPLTVPNIWYRASFAWPADGGGEEHRMTGITLPGAPAMVLGSNGHIAWGFTNLQGDNSDVILLEPDPAGEDSYLSPEGSRRFERHQEVISVRGGEDELLEVVETHWGPVIENDALSRSRAFRWTVYEEGAVNFDIFDLESARTVDQAVEVANRLGIPPLNFIVADRGGRIGWTVAGRLPWRFGFDGRRPASWADGSRGWHGLLPPSEVPRVLDPESGRLWSANNRAVGGDMLVKLGNGGYVLGARAKQIRDALFALDGATEKDMLAIQLDNRALFLARWRDRLLERLTPEALKDRPRRAQLRGFVEDWGGHAAVDSVGYRMVAVFRLYVMRKLLHHLTAPCREADPDFRIDVDDGEQHEGPFWRMVSERPRHLLPPAYASWEELELAAVDEVLERFSGNLAESSLGQRNTAAIRHPLGLPGLAGWLDMPADRLPGDSFMPRVQNPVFGASERMAVSPGQEEEGIFHMPGGQSGHPSSPHYRDGHEAWVRGDPTPFLPGEPVSRLMLVPRAP